MIPNNYMNQPQNMYYQQGQPIPVQGYPNNNGRPNSFDNVKNVHNNYVNNTHYLHNSPPPNLNNRTISYGNVYPTQSHLQQQNTITHVYPIAHHQDVKFNYAVNQQKYSINSQPIYNQVNVIPSENTQNIPVKINTPIPPPPQIQPTIQSGVQTSTVVTTVTNPPPIQTTPV